MSTCAFRLAMTSHSAHRYSLHKQHLSGGGPTVAHTLEVSKRPEDLWLVTAAANGDVSAVEDALPAAQLEAHVRLPGRGDGSGTKGYRWLHPCGCQLLMQLLMVNSVDYG